VSNFSSNLPPSSVNIFLRGSSSVRDKSTDVTGSDAGPDSGGTLRLSREIGSTFEWTRPAR
ncbi:hypothetical protein ARMSODRAFT_842535, partial [Armillaria solidipes]